MSNITLKQLSSLVAYRDSNGGYNEFETLSESITDSDLSDVDLCELEDEFENCEIVHEVDTVDGQEGLFIIKVTIDGSTYGVYVYHNNGWTNAELMASDKFCLTDYCDAWISNAGLEGVPTIVFEHSSTDSVEVIDWDASKGQITIDNAGVIYGSCRTREELIESVQKVFSESVSVIIANETV